MYKDFVMCEQVYSDSVNKCLGECEQHSQHLKLFTPVADTQALIMCWSHFIKLRIEPLWQSITNVCPLIHKTKDPTIKSRIKSSNKWSNHQPTRAFNHQSPAVCNFISRPHATTKCWWLQLPLTATSVNFNFCWLRLPLTATSVNFNFCCNFFNAQILWRNFSSIFHRMCQGKYQDHNNSTSNGESFANFEYGMCTISFLRYRLI